MRKFSEVEIAQAKAYAAMTPPEVIDPKIEALVNDLIGRIADKWTMLILEVLAEKGELRFTRAGRIGDRHQPEDADANPAADGTRRSAHAHRTPRRAAAR